jgi:Ca2+-binding RTX toxin-like protein
VSTNATGLPPQLTISYTSTASCARVAATIVGTAGNNRLTGTPRSDVIVAGPGNDKINGRGRADSICGGLGNDWIAGAGGNDRLLGGLGRDRLFGGPGRDRLSGGPGNDRIFGRDRQRDVIDCGPGQDVVIVDAVDRVRRCETVLRVPAPRGRQRPAPPAGLG